MPFFLFTTIITLIIITSSELNRKNKNYMAIKIYWCGFKTLLSVWYGKPTYINTNLGVNPDSPSRHHLKLYPGCFFFWHTSFKWWNSIFSLISLLPVDHEHMEGGTSGSLRNTSLIRSGRTCNCMFRTRCLAGFRFRLSWTIHCPHLFLSAWADPTVLFQR